MTMTDRDREALGALIQHWHQNGYAPTIRELGARIGLSSPATSQRHVDRLRRLGMVEGAGRSLRPVVQL